MSDVFNEGEEPQDEVIEGEALANLGVRPYGVSKVTVTKPSTSYVIALPDAGKVIGVDVRGP